MSSQPRAQRIEDQDQFDDEEPMDMMRCPNIIFHGFDAMVGLLLVIDGLVLLTNMDSFISFLLPIYFAVFGCLIILFVLYVPGFMIAMIPFYFSFVGRALLFLLIGSVVLVFPDFLSSITAAWTIITAFIYLLFSIWINFACFSCVGLVYFLPNSLPPPYFQRDTADSDPYKENKPASIDDANKQLQIISDDNKTTSKQETGKTKMTKGASDGDQKEYGAYDI